MSTEEEDQALKKHRWEDASGASSGATMSTTRWSSATPRQYNSETPIVGSGAAGAGDLWRGLSTPGTATPSYANIATPRFGDHTPMMGGAKTPSFGGGGITPLFMGATPLANGAFAPTPNYQFEGSTPMQSHYASVEGQTALTAAIEKQAKQLEKVWRLENKRLTAEYLDSILPTEYFTLVPVPADYNPAPPDEPNFYEQALKMMDASMFANPTADVDANGKTVTYDIPDNLGDGMPAMKPEDAAVFVELLKFHNVGNIPDESLPSYLLMKNLFKIKNGDVNQRRAGTRFLLEKCRVLGSNFILQRMFYVWRANIMTLQEKHYYIDFTKALIARLGRVVRSSTKEVVHMMESLLSAQEQITREDGKQVLILLTRVVGFPSVLEAIKVDFAHEENVVRRHTAKAVAIACYAAGTAEVMPALSDLSYAPSAFARQTVVRALGEMASLLGHAIIGALGDMVPMLERLVRDEKRVRRDAAAAIASIAEAVAPYGIEELAPLVDVVTDACTKGMGSSASPFLNAFGALVPLMAPYDAQARTSAMMPTLVSQFSTPEDEYRRVLLRVVQKCVSADGVPADFIRGVIMEPFFEGFWRVRRVAADRKTAGVLIETTVAIAKKLGSVEILRKLVPEMKDENELYQRMVINAVRLVVQAAGTAAVPESLLAFLLDGAVAAVRQDERGTNLVVMDGLAVVCNSLGPRLKPYLKQIFDLINRRRESPESTMRAQAAELTALVAHTVMLAEGTVFLQDVGRSLYERLEDDDANALSSNLKATRAILKELGAQRYKPSVRELLRKLTFVIKNRFSTVQQNTIALIEDIATNYDNDVEAIHLHELATKGLFPLLDAERRETRRACARTFGVIAQKIRPFAIILELVDNFSQDKRKIRICTAVALGSIAKACGPLTVIPYLLNEYKLSEGKQVAVIVQHAVLKAIRYVFECTGSTGKDYVYAFIPLMERALTETSLQMRRMAVEACTAIMHAISCEDGFEGVATHLLNFIHPNIVELLSKNEPKISEERLKMVSAVVSYYEAARLILGSGRMLQYLLQGLFHPARKVRDIYRRTYNMVYIASPESMVPYYPRVDNDDQHTYTRHELEITL